MPGPTGPLVGGGLLPIEVLDAASTAGAVGMTTATVTDDGAMRTSGDSSVGRKETVRRRTGRFSGSVERPVKSVGYIASTVL